MKYTNSPLVDCTVKSPNHSGVRTHKIDRITPHCVVSQCSAETLGSYFPANRQASCNYGIGQDGRVCLIVDEANRSWCSSNNSNDQRAITIECASDTTAPYAFKDACYQKLIKLCIDICQRNNINKMIWINDKKAALAYEPKDGEGLFTVHRWFANKSCPGDWLYNRMDELCAAVNAGLNANYQKEEEEEMTQEKFNEMMNNYLNDLAEKAPTWEQSACDWAQQNGIISGDEKGRIMAKKFMTRGELVAVLERFYKKIVQ